MNRLIVAVLCGLLFGAGMVVSDMINPARVLAFLDVTGAWDASLAFVMGSALAITVPGFWWLRKTGRAPATERGRIDAPLLIGAGLFGLGWGIAGYCPGPALASLVSALPQVFTFCAAMLAGMWLYDRTLKPRA